MMHSPIQVAVPDMAMRFDTDLSTTVATRGRMLEEYADSGHLVIPGHFPPPTGGFIQRGEGGTYRWEPKAD